MPQPDHDLISDPSECSAGSAKTDSECQQCEANTYSRDGAYSPSDRKLRIKEWHS